MEESAANDLRAWTVMIYLDGDNNLEREAIEDFLEIASVGSSSEVQIVGVLADLQGPKIRTGRFVDNRVQLIRGERFILDADLGEDEGTNERVGITYKDLPKDVKPGNQLMLDDGRVELEVVEVGTGLGGGVGDNPDIWLAA